MSSGRLFDKSVFERGLIMKDRASKMVDIIARSVVFVVINYLLVSAELSFRANILGLMASIANIWMITDFYQSIKMLTEKKGMAILVDVICFVVSIAIAYFVGYVHGTIRPF